VGDTIGAAGPAAACIGSLHGCSGLVDFFFIFLFPFSLWHIKFLQENTGHSASQMLRDRTM
jgi:hypothetical protein